MIVAPDGFVLEGGGMESRGQFPGAGVLTLKRRVLTVTAAVATAIGGMTLLTDTAAHAYGGAGSMGVYQVGLSFNDNGPTSGGSGGGFWGWWEFDSPQNNSAVGTGGDGQAEGCGHGGGFNGAGHSVYDISDWYIQYDPQMGIPTFWASWSEVDTFRGQSSGPYQVIDESTGIPAFSMHRPLLQLFGVPTPPGQSINVQVAWKPAH